MLQVLWIIGSVLAISQAYSPRDANAYIDYVLNGPFVEEQQYSRLDPYKLPDINIKLVSKKTTNNEANLTMGRILNLSKIQRVGDCSAPHWQSANISFTCRLTFDDLTINYTANVVYDNKKFVSNLKTAVKGTVVNAQITTTKEENIPGLRMFFISDIGRMTVYSKMTGDVDKTVFPPVRDSLVGNSTTNLHKALHGRFKDALGFSIYKTPVPFVEE